MINQAGALISTQYGTAAEIDDDGTLLNFGTLTTAASGKSGIKLIGDGSIVNGANAIIQGGQYGVFVEFGQASISNAGTIAAGSTIAGSTVASVGIDLSTVTASSYVTTATFSSYVTNAAMGTIIGTTGIADTSGPGTVVNAGSILGGGAGGVGITLSAGGEVDNQGLITATTLANTGNLAQANGVVISGGAGTVSNVGSIYGHNLGIDLAAGGVFKNQVGGMVAVNVSMAGAGYADVSLGGTVQSTVINAGTIGTAAINLPSPGITAIAGLYLSNLATGTIGGSYGALVSAGGGTVVNQGLIQSQNTVDSILPSALLIADPNSNGISVTNSTGGTISGAVAISLRGGLATVSNAGLILSTATVEPVGAFTFPTIAAAISLGGGGMVTNSQGGSIVGGGYGIISPSKDVATTVINAGQISASRGVSIIQGFIDNESTGTITSTQQNTSPLGALLISEDATVVNSGTISSYIYFENTSQSTNAESDVLQNSKTGTINSVIFSGSGTVTNYGTVGSLGVFPDGSTIVNGAGGYIGGVGLTPGSPTGAITSLFNSGTIISQVGTVGDYGAGVRLAGPTVIYNLPGGLITGLDFNSQQSAYGILVSQFGFNAPGTADARTTVENAGTIMGGSRPAIYLNNGGSNRIIVDPGAVFESGGNSLIRARGPVATNVIELTAGTGRLPDFGGISGFGSVVFDAGAAWTIEGSGAGLAAPVISGFASGDMIDIDGFISQDASFANGYLNLTSASSGHVALNLGGNFTTASFIISSDGAGGTDVAVACFRTGTCIATPAGQTLVEDLSIGDDVLTASGEVRPVKWIGKRGYMPRVVAANKKTQPILFRAGSLADGIPCRDLFVSAQHAMFLDGVLVPAASLVNGSSIVRAASPGAILYLHIELETHDVILAEGAPAETFIDDDSRGIFHNAAEFAKLYPDAPPSAGFCAPRVEDGYKLEEIRIRLASRARDLAGAVAA